jgi:hypothetical protein
LQVLLLGFAVLLTEIPAFAVEAEGKVDGMVIAGSKDNRISIAITNPSAEIPVADADLAVSEPGRWIGNIRIEKDARGPIPPGGVRRFTVFFEILPDAQHGAVDSVTLQVTGRGALVDHPSPVVSVRIENPDQTAVSGSDLPPVLKLIRIQGPAVRQQASEYVRDDYSVSYREGEAGFSAAHRSGHYPDWVQALRVTSAPTEIALGEPFEFAAELKKRKIHDPGERCYARADSAILYPARSIGYKKETDPTLQSPRLIAEPGNARAVGRDDLHVYCRSNDTSVAEGRVVNALVEKEGSVSLRLVFTPERVEVDEGVLHTKRKYHYRLDFVTDGKLEGDASGSEVRRDHVIVFKQKADDYAALSQDEGPPASVDLGPFRVRFIIGGTDISTNITLYYDTVSEGGRHVASLPGYQWPDELLRPPRDGRGRDADTPGVTTAYTPGSGVDSGSSADGGRDEGQAQGSLDPNRIDPASRTVAPIIREWLNIAEPPENATEGANLQYDKWGRRIGTTADGSAISPSASPTYARATPEETVWSIRQTLDSVNHCTLEAYVLAKLNNQSIADCLGRYSAPQLSTLSDLSGFSLKEAKAWLESKSLGHGLLPAGPAPTQVLSYKIKETDPQAGARVKPGSKVTLKVYSEYRQTAGGVSVPGVVGLAFDQAAARLKSAGLTIKRGDDVTPVKKELAGTVRSQVPEAGSKTSRGAPVELVVYGEYVPETKPLGGDIPPITGTYDRGNTKVTKENGYYVGRTYRDASEYERKGGYRYGMVIFKFKATPVRIQGYDKPVYRGEYLFFDYPKQKYKVYDAIIERQVNTKKYKFDKLLFHFNCNGKKNTTWVYREW